MKRILAALLVLLILFLAASNARLLERERILEERLAAAERRKAPKPAPEAAAPAVVAAKAEPSPEPGTPRETVRVETAKPPAPAVIAEAPKPAVSGTAVVTERFLQNSMKALKIELADGSGLAFSGEPLQLTLQSAEPPLPEGRKPGYLGISGGDAKGGGAQVTDVFPNGVAGAAGLKSGDVIVEFNGESVQGLADLARRVRESGEGAPISLRIRRDGSEFYQGVQLGPRPQ